MRHSIPLALVRDEVSGSKQEDSGGQQGCGHQKTDRQMAPEDGKSKGDLLTQDLVLAPRSHKRGATSEYNHTGHDEEQRRCAEARDVRGRPVEDNPTCAGGFELPRLQQA